MKKDTPDARVIEVLNDALTAELTAVNQYFVHAEMCQNWGYERLYHRIRKEAIDEMKHAESLIERILYLGGVPNVQRLSKITIGETVPEQLSLDYAVEREAVLRLNAGLEVCREAGDNGSRIILEQILHDEEEHIDWIEAQLELLEQVGEANYLAQQIRGDE